MTNKPITKFTTKNKRVICIFQLSIAFFPEILDFYRRLIKEDTYINKTGLKSPQIEKIKFQRKMEDIKSGKSFSVWGLYENKIIAGAHFTGKSGRSKHVGEVGLMVDKDFRGEGIGKFLLTLLIKEAKKMGLKLLILDTFAENEKAISLYKKMGFKEYGYLKKALFYKNKYSDSINMAKEI